MKNSNLFLMMAALFALISCGTANRSAHYSGSQFRNSVYYTPGSRSSSEYVQQMQQLEQLKENTAENLVSAEGEYAYNYNTVPDTKGEEVSYSFIDNGESYEARLRKFDSPTYTINIDIVDPYPWWNIHYSWYPGRYWRHHHAWYSPSWYWYSPSWHWGWHDPWYTGPYWGWYDPFYDPWWGPGYRPGFHPVHRPGLHPGHYPGHGPGAAPDHRPGREVYYGKRNSSPTYNNADRGMVSNGERNPSARPATGSATRRQPAVTQINGGTRNPAAPSGGTVSGNSGTRPQNAGVQQQHKPQQQSGNGQYRRVAPDQQKSKGPGTVNQGSKSGSKSSSSYSRSSSQGRSSSYSRGSSSQTRSSSYSSGSSYSGGSRNSGATRSSGSSSGSSYRRR